MSQLSDLLTTKVTINDEERKTSLILLCFALALYSVWCTHLSRRIQQSAAYKNIAEV